MCDCNELEQVGELGAHALLERAVRRIEEKDQIIRQQNEYIDALLEELQSQAATFNPPVIVFMDDIPAGFYEGEVVDDYPGYDPDFDDYEFQQALYSDPGDCGC